MDSDQEHFRDIASEDFGLSHAEAAKQAGYKNTKAITKAAKELLELYQRPIRRTDMINATAQMAGCNQETAKRCIARQTSIAPGVPFKEMDVDGVICVWWKEEPPKAGTDAEGGGA